MSDAYEQLLRARAGNSTSALLQWRQAAQRLVSTGLPPEAVQRLLEASPDAATASRLAGRCERGGPDHAEAAWEELIRAVDASDYGLRAWLEAIDAFYAALAGRAGAVPLVQAIAYVDCTAEAGAAAGSTESLSSSVESMVRDYGYAGKDGGH